MSHTLAELADLSDGSQVVVGGLVGGMRRLITRNGETMAVLNLEDFGGQVEVVLFPRLYGKIRTWLAPEAVVLIKGRIDKQEEGVQILAEEIKQVSACRSATPENNGEVGPRLYLKLADKGLRAALQEVLKAYPGDCPVYLYLSNEGRTFILDRRLWVNPVPALLSSLATLLGGQDKVKLVPEK